MSVKPELQHPLPFTVLKRDAVATAVTESAKSCNIPYRLRY